MFNVQHKTNNHLKHLDLLREWEEQNPTLIDKNKRNYINRKFFDWLSYEYQQNGKYKEEFGSCIDLITRHNIATHEWLEYDDLYKSDLYEYAVYRCVNYAINTWDREKGSAFVYFQSAIKNAFKEIANKYYKEKEIVKKLRNPSKMDEMIDNYKPQDITSIKESFYDTVETKSNIYNIDNEEELNFYKEILEIAQVPTLTDIKILVDKNVPRFKRKYIHFDYVLPIDYVEKRSSRLKKVNITVNKGIIIDFIPLSTKNERNGLNKYDIQKKAVLSRREGHQYFAVYDFQWREYKNVILAKLKELISTIRLELIGEEIPYVQEKSNLMLDYIPYSVIEENGITEPSFYLLKDDYDTLHLSLEQKLDDYLTWLNTYKEGTRTWDAGFVKKEKDL